MFDADSTAKTDARLRIAKWHLDELARTPPATSVETIEFTNRAADHADVVTVFSAGTVEAHLNSFVLSPLLVMEEEGPRRFIAELLTKYLRLDMPKKLKFLRNRVTALKGSEVLNRVHDLCERRNAILHTSFKYEEVKSLPTEPYVPGLHDHLPESAFAQRPRLSTRRSFPRPPLEQAQADYDTACEFLKLMYDTIPYEPWPPPRFNSRSPEFRRCDAVQVAHGSTFGIELIERSTAGYTWRLEQPVDGVELLESSLTPPPAGHAGASGTRHFRFRATKRGNYGLVFQLRREWEEDPVERRTVQIEVT